MMFSPVGKLVDFVSNNNTVRLWGLSARTVLHMCRVPSLISRLSFSKVWSYLETDKGFFDFLPASSSAYYSHQPAIDHISLQDRWIVGTMRDLLWLPIDYLAECWGVQIAVLFSGMHVVVPRLFTLTYLNYNHTTPDKYFWTGTFYSLTQTQLVS